MVLDIHDHSLDVLSMEYGVVKRVYIDVSVLITIILKFFSKVIKQLFFKLFKLAALVLFTYVFVFTIIVNLLCNIAPDNFP